MTLSAQWARTELPPLASELEDVDSTPSHVRHSAECFETLSRKQLQRRRVYDGSMFKGTQTILSEKFWWQELEAAGHIGSLDADNEQEEEGVRRLLEVPDPSQTAPPARDQMFKYMRSQGTFHIQLTALS